MTRDEILAEIARLGPWHHDVEVEPGIRTRAAPLSAEHSDQRTPTTYRPEQHVQDIVSALYPAGLEGRSFLDCACNGGGHSLTAARLGAGRCFGFDARRHWVEQADFLKRFAPRTAMDFAVATLDDLPSLDLPQFDVTLFSGIFYHLPDPVHGLRLAADRTREMLILNTAAKWGPDKALRLERESPDEVMSGVDGLAWLPTGPAVLRDILAWCGFPHSRLSFHRATAQGWSRIELFAARDAGAFRHFDATASEARPLGPPPPPPGRLRRLLGKLPAHRRLRPNMLLISPDRLDTIGTAECRDWVTKNIPGTVDGIVRDDGQFVVTFPTPADADKFRRRWLP